MLKHSVLGVVVCLAVQTVVLAQGPSQPLYVTAGDQGKWFIVQGSNVTTINDSGGDQYAIAVGSTVRILAVDSGASGAEYTLAGTPTGTTYPNNFGNEMIDGTTDGTHNYAVQWNLARVISYDTNWANPTVLFGGLATDTIGITYDPVDNTFWTASRNNGLVQHFSLTGTFLGQFSVSGGPTGIAYNPADGTLWVLLQSNANQLAQYSTGGALLGTASFPQLAAVNSLGLEFQEASATPFAAFSTKPMTINPFNFSLNASFTLPGSGPAFNPLTQPLTLQVGTSTVVIPAGSFHGSYGYMFQGMINGSWVTASISPAGGNMYLFSIRGGPIAMPGGNSVQVTLTVGGYTGTALTPWVY